jgi:hypothetical protein
LQCLLWVKSGHSRRLRSMSALPLKADFTGASLVAAQHSRFKSKHLSVHGGNFLSEKANERRSVK